MTQQAHQKAIERILQLGLWFQQREDQYRMELRTGSVAAIDDISIDEDNEHVQDEPDRADDDHVEGPGSNNPDMPTIIEPPNKAKKKKRKRQKLQSTEPIQ